MALGQTYVDLHALVQAIRHDQVVGHPDTKGLHAVSWLIVVAAYVRVVHVRHSSFVRHGCGLLECLLVKCRGTGDG